MPTDDVDQSPASVVANLLQHTQKNSKPQPNTDSWSILKPLDNEVMYLTKPIPFKKPTTGDKIEVLNVEKFYGKEPDWKNFDRAQKVDQIGEKPLKTASTKENIPYNSNLKTLKEMQNKENRRQNYTADTMSFDGSNLDFTDTGSVEFESISESATSPRRGHKHNDVYEKVATTITKSHAASTKRSRSPAFNGQSIQSATGVPVHSMASAPALGFSHASIGSNVSSGNFSKTSSRNENVNSYNTAQTPPFYGGKLSLPNYNSTNMTRQPYNHPQAVGVSVSRSSSQCSTNSEFTHADGKFLLKANKGELVWNCTQLRHTVTKDFMIKNMSDKRISLRIEVIGPGFQLVNIDTVNSLTLHAGESTKVAVAFCPTVVGRAKGKIHFEPLKGWPNEVKRTIMLYAYGGRTSLQCQGLERGTAGLPFLKLGDTNDTREPFTRTFTIHNSGPLTGVAHIGTRSDSGRHLSESTIMIEPRKCVIRPNSSVDVRVTYNMRRRDLVKIMQKTGDVFRVGTVEVITGSEANRLRLESLLRKKECNETLNHALKFLVDDFPVLSNESFDDFGESAVSKPNDINQ